MNFSWPRILFGITVLAALAIYDLHEKGRNATRWREYAFLAFCVVVAIAYGVVNDQITSRISWEYFYYGKELYYRLGPQTPPDPTALSWQAVRIGTISTWWAGLIIGAVILIANNPSRGPAPLRYSRLAARLPGVIGITVACAMILAIAGQYYLLNGMSPDFANLAQTNLWRPHRFMTVYGAHLGGYIGGGIGAVYAFLSVRRERRSLHADFVV
jgi:membrane associated rhomboid family serine protease